MSKSNVNRLRHVASVHKVSGGHKCAKIAIFDDFGGVVTIATADSPIRNCHGVANSTAKRVGHVKIVHICCKTA